MSEYTNATRPGAKLEPLQDLLKKYTDRIELIEKRYDSLEAKIHYNNNRTIVSLNSNMTNF